MTDPIPKRRHRQFLPAEGEDWLRGVGTGGAWRFLTSTPLETVWRESADRIVAEHVRVSPGSRPAHWWTYSAPEARQRLGGKGDTLDTCTTYAPALAFGIPILWRRHGDIFTIGVPVDPTNPPAFESQAAFLGRHKLFLPGERRRLKPANFEPELIEP